MTRISGPLKSSLNSGQLSVSLKGKINLKQYYSGAIQMKGVEPIPQSGLNLLPGSRYAGAGVSGVCNKTVLKISNSLSYTLIITVGRVDIWRHDRVHVATLTGGAIAAITADMLPDLRFYGEANTVGIFHVDLWNGIRLLRNAANDTVWTASTWPYGELPQIDLGGTYAKTTDRWEFFLRYTGETPSLVLSVSVDGNSTGGISLLSIATTDIVPPGTAVHNDWVALAAAIETAIEDLPGMSPGVTVTYYQPPSSRFYRVFSVEFSGSLIGSEYDFSAQIMNTADASVLVAHTEIGKTEGEPLISAARGGFAGMSLFQDRACYFAAKARSASINMSRIGEYFDLNITAQQDNAARLDALRTETSEEILFLIDATYLLAFTNKNVYFASNRTIERNKPLNWVNAYEAGIRRNCPPVKLEGKVYFVTADGGRLFSAAYDAVSEVFQPSPENDLNGSDPADLVRNIRFIAVQHKSGTMAADRLWILREDGRVVVCVVNKSQEIMAACEWPIAGGGFAKGLVVDGLDQVWLTIDRNGAIVEEVLEEENINLFQMMISVTTDLTGQAAGLSPLDGKTVWAEIDNDIFGPFTVSSGAIPTGIPSRPAKIGIWTPPVHESMPYVRVLGNDDVVRRPGKVGSVRLYVQDTASIAIGANGRPAKDVSLARASDDGSVPKINFTGHVPVAGLIGACMDPTLTITQVRPGRLHVRDYVPGVKL